MKKKNITQLMIIDASGSMKTKVEEVQGGINQLFKDIKKEAKENDKIKCRVTMVDFSSHNDFRVLYNNAKPSELSKLKDGDYSPRSMTALFDAIGKAFQLIPEDKENVLVNIFTDGLENDSKEFTEEIIKSLIKEKQNQGWIITFLGTSLEAMNQASSIGISESDYFPYADTKEGTSVAFNLMSSARDKYSKSIQDNIPLEDIFDKKKNQEID